MYSETLLKKVEFFQKDKVKTLFTKKILLLTFGFSGAFSFAPYDQFYCFYMSTAFLFLGLWFAQSKEFWIGFFWGWGFFIGNLFWIQKCLMVDPQSFGWLSPLSLFGLPAVFAFYPAFLGQALKQLKQKNLSLTQFAFAFTLGWPLMEILQSYLLTGFPWTLSAYIWHWTPLAQTISVLGCYGLGLCTLSLTAGIGIFLANKIQKEKVQWKFMAASVFLLLGLCSYGILRLCLNPTQLRDDFHFRLVQPMIAQKEKGNLNYAYAHMATLIQYSFAESKKPLTHIIWPEAAIPWCLNEKLLVEFPDLQKSFSKDASFVLMTGANYKDMQNNLWNALCVKFQDDVLRPCYYKSHLVPFGEYFPLRGFLSAFISKNLLRSVSAGLADFKSSLPQQKTVCQKTPCFRTLICYEDVFANEIELYQTGCEWLLSITNDGWFGYSPGPFQHFVHSKYRAIEQGLPCLRVANTGISAVIDPLGRVLAFLPLNQAGFLDTFLPKPLQNTFYRQFHHLLFWILFVFLAVVFLWHLQKNKKKGSK